MARNTRYQQLKPGSDGPEVCVVHRLLKRDKVSARIDAEKLQREAEPGSPNSWAKALLCTETGTWHIFIPTKGRAKTLRRQARGGK